MYYINLRDTFSKRYSFGKFSEFVDGTYDVLSSFFLVELEKLSPEGIYRVTGQEKRPDLISYSIYGDVQYWWILMQYNGIIFVDDIIEGMEMKYPSISDLEDIYFSLNRLKKRK